MIKEQTIKETRLNIVKDTNNYRYKAFAHKSHMHFAIRHQWMDYPIVHGCDAHHPDHSAEKYCYQFEYKSGEIIRAFGD